MLDKLVPYYSIIMKRPANQPVPSWSLPGGLRVSPYRDGSDHDWAEIETAVGEFNGVDEARRYFGAHYLAYPEKLRRRLLFVRNTEGVYLATITAWWNDTGERRDASIHWLAVRPTHHRMGLGKALVAACLNILYRVEGDQDIWLHTQTSSHLAIRLYLQAGFQIVPDDTFGGYANEYEQAIPILKALIPLLKADSV